MEQSLLSGAFQEVSKSIFRFKKCSISLIQHSFLMKPICFYQIKSSGLIWGTIQLVPPYKQGYFQQQLTFLLSDIFIEIN